MKIAGNAQRQFIYNLSTELRVLNDTPFSRFCCRFRVKYKIGPQWDGDLHAHVRRPEERRSGETAVRDLSISPACGVHERSHLLLNNAGIRHVIGTITSTVVLILGRATPPASGSLGCEDEA